MSPVMLAAARWGPTHGVGEQPGRKLAVDLEPYYAKAEYGIGISGQGGETAAYIWMVLALAAGPGPLTTCQHPCCRAVLESRILWAKSIFRS